MSMIAVSGDLEKVKILLNREGVNFAKRGLYALVTTSEHDHQHIVKFLLMMEELTQLAIITA